jgi:hypothetical protein
MGLDPYAVRLQKERDDRAHCDQIIAKVINDPVNKVMARFGLRPTVVQDDLNKAARDHAPDAFDMLERVRRGETVTPYPEAATRHDNRTAQVLNLRRSFLEAAGFGRVEAEVNANDIVRARTQPRAVAKSTFADALPALSKEQLVHALRAAEAGSVEFVTIARALAQLE